MALADEIIIEIKAEVDKAVKGLKKTEKGVKDLEKTSSSAFKVMQGVIAGVVAVLGSQLVGAAKEALKVFVDFDQAARASLQQFGVSADEIISKLNKFAGGTIDATNLVLTANRSMTLGVTKDLDKMGTLLEFARIRARAMGITTQQAFDNIVTGIARNSPLILDNVGLITKGWSEEAKAAGVAYDSQFILNKVLQQAGTEIQRVGPLQATYSEMLQQLGARAKNFQIIVGKELVPAVENLVAALGDMENSEATMTVIERGGLAVVYVINVLISLFQSLVARINYFGAVAKLWFAIAKTGVEALIEKTGFLSGIFGTTADAIGKITEKVKELTSKVLNKAGEEFDKITDATGEIGDATKEVAKAAAEVARTDLNGIKRGFNDLKNLILGIKKETDDGIISQGAFDATEDSVERLYDSFDEFWKAQGQFVGDSLNSLISSLDNFNQIILDKQLARYESELDALEEHKRQMLEEENIYQQQLDAIESAEFNERVDKLRLEKEEAIKNGDEALAADLQRQIDKMIAAQESEEFIQGVEAETAKKKEDLEKKIAEAKRKAAIADKAIAAVQATINTALAVTNALTIPPPAGIAMAAVVGALGAVEVAAILAQQIPQYALGAPRIDRPTLAMVGEGSTPEAIVPLPDGRSIPVQMQGGGGVTINGNLIIQPQEPYYDSWTNNLRRYTRENGGIA